MDGRVTDDWLAGLELALNGKSVDYLVVQHMEPDHSGSVQELADRFPADEDRGKRFRHFR